MFDRFKNSRLFKAKSVAGIHIILSESKYDINAVILRKKGSSVEIEKKMESLSTMEELIKGVPANVPICLSIDGKGVIHKRVSAASDDPDKEVLNKVIPGAGIEDFILCRNQIDEKNSFASIIRNEIISEIFEEFTNKKRFVISLNLGPFSINQAIPFLKEKKKQIHTGTYLLGINDSTIYEYGRAETQELPKMYRIDNEEILEHLMVPFSNAVGYFVLETDESNPYIVQNREEFAYKQMFIKSGWTIMILLFSILLINYLLFDHYNKKQSELSTQVEQNKNLLIQLDTLTKELQLKENFIAKSDFLKSSKQSFFADRLANTIPQNILLTKMDIQPLLKKMKNGDAPEFQKGTVIISGLTNSTIVFNDWIKDLNKEKWIAELEVLNYIRENSRSSGSFIIEVIINGMDLTKEADSD